MIGVSTECRRGPRVSRATSRKRYVAARYAFVAVTALAATHVSLVRAAPDTEAERADSSEQLLQQGREAFEGKRYEEAQERLSRAYRLLQSYRTACALGQVELELEMYRDAAEHLDICVSRYPEDDPQQARERVLEGLRETRRHVAVFEPLINVRGATILINGVEVSATPLESDLFVEPGLRRVTVRKAGYRDVSAELFFPAGGTTQWQAILTPQVSASHVAVASSPGSVYVGVGAALTAVTLAGGVALSVIAHAEQADAERAVSAARESGDCPASSTRGVCVAARERVDSASRSSDLAAGALWAGAGLGVATVVIALATSSNSSSERSQLGTAGLRASVSFGGVGASWTGQF